MKIRVTKEFHFEAAHALDHYDGKCKDIHGHSYHLTVTLLGSPISDNTKSECGMVIDFSTVKKVLNTDIIPDFDHRLLLRQDSRFAGIETKNERVRYVEYQPTCENMLIEIVQRIQSKFPDEVTLVEATLRETATSFATWKVEDNR
jgi:6-pyruvoyltetrahydropterin/6-carboxytetrahydropterin synthase